jgi:hypothetical protein
MKTTKPDGIVYFTAQNWRERIYKKIIEHRITTTGTVNEIGKLSNSLILVVYYAKWQKAIFILGRRIK